jgi:hypothetical protein
VKISRTRAYTVNMGNFESFRTEATVEVDTDKIVIEEGTAPQDAGFEYADKLLTQALAKDLSEAAQVTLTKDSFILTMEL